MQYAIAIAAVCIGAALSTTMAIMGEVRAEHGLLITAIALAASFGGCGPALLATVLATVYSGGFLTDPNGFLLGQRPEQTGAWVLLLLEGALTTLISTYVRPAWFSGRFQDGKLRKQSTSPDIDYKGIVDSIKGFAIVLLDTHGRVVTWTASGETITGCTSSEMIGVRFSILDADVTKAEAAYSQAMDTAVTRGNAALQRRCLRKSGTEFWADIVIGSVFNHRGELRGFSIALRDITSRKHAEDLLERRSQQLIEAGRLKDEFLATVSHELRTPLNSILGWAQLFRAGKLDEAGRRHALETIESSARTQSRLIEDLLDVSRIVTGKMRLEARSLQFAEVVKEALETIRPAAEAKGIAIHFNQESVRCPVFGDPARMQQIVWNLLSNAIKFTPQGGSVDVRLQRQSSTVQLQIKDTGIGIDEEFLPYIFDAFRQADRSSTRAHKGLGLGLSIVQRLTELHGGTVRAHSDGPGKGTTIDLAFPVETTPKSTPVIETIEPGAHPLTVDTVVWEEPLTATNSLRVVVVDDDPEAREMISTMLLHRGIHVDAVSSAAEGVSAVERLHPDVVVSDIEMPEEDGYAFIQEVRALDADHGGRTPAVALTAYTRAEDRSRSLAAGFQLHLAKPVECDELVNAIITLAVSRRKGPANVQTTRH